MINQKIVDQCRQSLIDAARRKQKITYGDLATTIGVANQSVGAYLNQIYTEEIEKGHPDLTLVAVYSGIGYGKYNSAGKRPQSVKFDSTNADDVQEYEKELSRVYAHNW
ncbi:MAG: hypothetical protein AB7U62_10180 [Pseudolabrys sp.]